MLSLQLQLLLLHSAVLACWCSGWNQYINWHPLVVQSYCAFRLFRRVAVANKWICKALLQRPAAPARTSLHGHQLVVSCTVAASLCARCRVFPSAGGCLYTCSIIRSLVRAIQAALLATRCTSNCHFASVILLAWLTRAQQQLSRCALLAPNHMPPSCYCHCPRIARALCVHGACAVQHSHQQQRLQHATSRHAGHLAVCCLRCSYSTHEL